MANVNNPHGLAWLGICISGGPAMLEQFEKDASEAAAIYPGDAVNQEADGNIEANSATPGTTLFSGVALDHGAALTLTKHRVIVSPDAIFEAQSDDDATGLVAADAGLNANLILGAGNATTLKSGHEIDTSTKATTATLDVKLRKLLAVEGNAYGEFARFEIMFNNHRNAYAVAGV